MSAETSDGEASFEFGYRDVLKKLPNGPCRLVRVPLTLDDVLHPREGDVHEHTASHDDDLLYLRSVLKSRFSDDRSVMVFSNCGIYWDIPGLKHHSPDLSVIFGVKRRKDWQTFHVKTEKVWPSLIIEVTSPSTRILDIKTKVTQYARAKVPHYVIADAQEGEGERRKITLIRYQLHGKAYKAVPLDSHGQAWLDPVGLWLGVKVNPQTSGDRLVLIDPASNEEIGDYTAIAQACVRAEARAREETRRAEAEAQARVEAQARAESAEARIRELEQAMKRRKPRE